MEMRYRRGPLEPKENRELLQRAEGEDHRPAGRLSDIVVEAANITIAAIFLYRRIKNLLRQERPEAEKGLEG
jgi:hypothetical protein